MLKKTILILTIIIPIMGIIIFNFFSKSHFDIPFYYQENIPSEFHCDKVSAPYNIDEDLKYFTIDSISLFPFNRNDIKIISISQLNDTYTSALNRVADEFNDNEGLKVYSFGLHDFDSKIPVSPNIIGLGIVDSMEQIKECIFLISPGSGDNTLLVDQQNRIRGYYDLMDVDFTDSLIVETKILLHQIKNENSQQ